VKSECVEEKIGDVSPSAGYPAAPNVVSYPTKPLLQKSYHATSKNAPSIVQWTGMKKSATELNQSTPTIPTDA